LVSAGAAAAKGFAKKLGVPVELLEKIPTSDGEKWLASYTRAGAVLDDVLAQKVEEALKVLPVQKLMRWGNNEIQFARPVHGLVMLHGKRVVPGQVLGVKSSNRTLGHRYLSRGMITLKHAEHYERTLLEQGKVVADFSKRRAKIKNELKRMEQELAQEITRTPTGRTLVSVQPFVIDTERNEQLPQIFPGTTSLDAAERALECSGGSALLDEVTSLVEWPRAYSGQFDKQFLNIPVECLALTMKSHQKYFPVFNKSAELLPYFVVIGNIDESLAGTQAKQSTKNIVVGNERVLRPRLADARFFYKQDCKIRLEERVPRLTNVMYHHKLGSQRDRVDRIKLFSGRIARDLGGDSALAERAAELSKADLVTEMVGEFPELQGVMGRYYALHDGESEIVANAIETHYRPRFAGDRLPEGLVACAVALADKLNSLAGFFGIGQIPTGDKDPFGLRRAALGVVRILIERDLSLSLHELVNAAFAGYNGRVGDAHTDLESFIFERLGGYLRDQGYSTLEVESVVSLRPVQINLTLPQVKAVREFNALPEAQSLAAANKRVVNILKQAEANGESFVNAEADKLQEPAERALFDALKITSLRANSLFKKGDFTGYLKTFAVLKSPVDAFFDSVMVMADAPELRHNRLALLADLRREMNRVADISKLAT
jgi:glycyl-tRNA synthetase beta chain